MMKWLAVCLSVCTAVAAIPLRCTHPLCDFRISYGRRLFTVEGHKIVFNYEDAKDNQISELLRIDCQGWQALDSPAMPQFMSEFRVSYVDLVNCPMPTHNTSLATALAALNVTLQPSGEYLFLELSEFPAEQLAPHHFVGLEQLSELKIYCKYGVDPHQRPTPGPGFLAGLRKLRFLHLVGVRLAAGELYRLPHSLTRLWLCGDSMNFLPGPLPEIVSETVRALPGLRYLMLDQWEFTAPEFTNSTNATSQLNSTYSLNSIQLMSWKDRQLARMEHCDVLQSLEISRAKVEELPDRWVAACPLLEEITLEVAEQLTSLPPKLLEGATALKRLTIRLTKIRSLPDGFLEGAPNLVKLDLSDNRLRGILPGGVFLGPALQSLSLEGNKLRTASLAAVAPLTSLTELMIGRNELVYDLCKENGYSLFQNLIHLKSLSLAETHVPGICHDWRENFTFLESLNLLGTSITTLKFTDFLCTRDASVKNAEITLSPSLYSVNFTKENYESALTISGSGVTFKFEPNWRYPERQVKCDCSAYWLRRAVDSTNHAIRIKNLTCKDSRDFNDVKPEEMCPEEARNVA